jgi:hypothetical protein
MTVHPTRRMIVAPLACLTLLGLAACGSSSPSVAHLPGGKKVSQPASSGGGSSDSSGGGNPGGSAQAHAAISIHGVSGATGVKFAACVRSHGVPDFPDPNAEGVFSMTGSAASLPQTAQFQDASTTCRKLLHLGGGAPTPAQTAAMLAKLLKYSECMRSHGVTSFPDPTDSNGFIGLRVHVGPHTGIDPSSPIFRRAQSACASLQPGGPGGP